MSCPAQYGYSSCLLVSLYLNFIHWGLSSWISRTDKKSDISYSCFYIPRADNDELNDLLAEQPFPGVEPPLPLCGDTDLPLLICMAGLSAAVFYQGSLDDLVGYCILALINTQDLFPEQIKATMSSRSDCNVHSLEFREPKPPQGDPSRPVSEFFRLDNRSVISNGFRNFTLANRH